MAPYEKFGPDIGYVPRPDSPKEKERESLEKLGKAKWMISNLEELGMAEPLDLFLAGLKPELNDGFDVLTGIYAVVIKNEEKAETGFLVRTWQDGNESRRLQITCDVTDVLKGN